MWRALFSQKSCLTIHLPSVLAEADEGAVVLAGRDVPEERVEAAAGVGGAGEGGEVRRRDALRLEEGAELPLVERAVPLGGCS